MFLEIHELRKSFGAGENRTEVLKGLDFSVEKGEICVLLGPSGSGKSTLLNIIGGIDEADGGYISINGEKDGRDEGEGTDRVPSETLRVCLPDVQSDPQPECKRKY